ncbi:hypothetical protein FACS1894211_09070 [Clostridia bacterium]|nr:hypothetical protein FACS1894211_09070 [Clostridia bacterium]
MDSVIISKVRSLSKTQKLCYAAVFTVLGVLLPLATSHAFGMQGTVFLPMHIPVLLCGLLCGTAYGAACGVLSAALSCLLTGMPPAYPMLPIMLAELSVYGTVSGLLYKKLRLPLYVSLPAAMIAGRAAYGILFALLNAFNPPLKALSVWGALATGLPGIAIQLTLLPLLVHALNDRFAFIKQVRFYGRTLRDAKRKIETGKAGLIVIKGKTVVCECNGRGVGDLLRVYDGDKEALRGAAVVDKVIGKAAAVILVAGGAVYAYGRIMSRAAENLLKVNGITIAYGELTDVILNVAGDGVCPIEQSVLNIDGVEEGLQAICARLQIIKNSSEQSE